jgi:transposase
MGQKRVNCRYPPEFINEAVALFTEQGYSVPKAAKSLGIRANLIYRWKQGKALEGNVLDALKRLRKEVKNLRMEKEILTKASAFFVKEMK